MVTTCPVCREVVHTSSGVIVSHGVRSHGILSVCSGSGSPMFIICDSCG
ncbi:MAG: hypothetical protein [Microvirus sp.]|nr:MAG: hypothetical protein [Microvirus sp.]